MELAMKASSEILLAIDNRRHTKGKMNASLHLHKLHYMERRKKLVLSSFRLG